MNVYLLTQEWCTPYEGPETVLIGVYDSMEKAVSQLKYCYEEDIIWLTDYGANEDTLEGNTLDEQSGYSHVKYDERWSINKIRICEVQ